MNNSTKGYSRQASIAARIPCVHEVQRVLGQTLLVMSRAAAARAVIGLVVAMDRPISARGSNVVLPDRFKTPQTRS